MILVDPDDFAAHPEASELGKLIEAYIKALEATDFAERLDKLEQMTNR
jgi:hypothetical protein